MIHQHFHIKAPLAKVWDALISPTIIEQWSGAPAEMSGKAKATFKLWNGDVWGTNTFVRAPVHLEQDWFGGKWDKPSKLCIALTDERGETIVTICHSYVPADEERDFANGWKNSYFEPLKAYVEAAA